MKIRRIKIQNFRALKDVTVDLEEDLSLIIGKNNCGKTSLLLALDKFIGSNLQKNHFSFDDFNINFKEALKTTIKNDEKKIGKFFFSGISLKLFIEYDETDDLSNIGNKVIMDLDPKNKHVVLAFAYSLPEEKLVSLKSDYKAYFDKKTREDKKPKDICSFLREQHSNYFKISKKSLLYDLKHQKEDNNVYTDLVKEKIQIDKIINFKWISARRNVSNKDTEKNLSTQSSKMYKKLEASNNNPDVIEEFKDALSKTDEDLDKIYEVLFNEVINDIKQFGGIKQNESIIKIVSSLQHKELLEENTTVMYGIGSTEHSLPENYNGLGYMNLISMIFEIKILLHEFQKEKDEQPSDINLLFIEEPEAHTHPQMQYVFIKNIKTLLKKGIVREDGNNRNLQTILSTHSSHIVSESAFEDIKYFKRENAEISSKNLKDLENEYSENKTYYKFLKQYLTLHRAELFFADKAIFIEGDTERILLPAIMKKLDQENLKKELEDDLPNSLPLRSQNISVIETGAYSQIFEKFIDFIGIKSLIITDIDSVRTISQTDDNGEIKKNADGTDKTKDELCPVSDGEKTSNSSLKYFYGNSELKKYIELDLDKRILKKDTKTKEWKNDRNGQLLCVYQTKENNTEGSEYHARSFEDSFFHINKKFIKTYAFDKDDNFIGDQMFPSLVQYRLKAFCEGEIDAYCFADKGIKKKKKPSLAMEILLNSKIDDTTGHEFSNWNTPAYIREGLEWLKQD